MDVGLALPQFDYSVPGEEPLAWATTRDWARHAERLGFGSVWLADHLFLGLEKYGAPPAPHDGLDVLVGLGALARATERVRLGTLVVCAQLRPPSLLAKALATVDCLSGGRLVVGMGAGWYEPEYLAAGVPFERPGVRLDQLAEAIQIVRGMFGGGPFTFEGRHWSVHEAPCLPRPVQQPAPPVWVGGRGDRLLDLVARHADGWNTVWAITPDAYRQRLAVLARACERIGRDPASVTLSVGLSALVGDDEADVDRRYERLQAAAPPGVVDRTPLDEWRQGRLVGTVAQVREQVAGWADLGVASLIVNLSAVPFAVTAPDDLAMVATATIGGTLGSS